MKRSAVRAGAWALLLPVSAAAQLSLEPVEPADSVTLEEAVSLALQAAPQVVQAEAGVQTAGLATRQAYASMLPNLSLSTQASMSSSERFDPDLNATLRNQSNSYSAGLSTSMDVFAGGRNLAAVRSAQASELAAEATVVTRRFSVSLAAKRAFFAVLRAEELIRLNGERIAQAEEQLGAAERRLRAGRATRSDVLRARLQLATARQSLLESETQRRSAMYALGQLVGVVGPVAATGPESLEPEPLSMTTDRLRELAVSEAPSVLASAAELNVARAGLSQARAQWYPTIGVRGNYNWNNQELALGDGRTSWSTSVSLSYPLFSGLQRTLAMDRADAQVQLAQATAAEAERAALSEFERLLGALALAQEQLVILEESVEVAREDYRVQQERYEHGAATILELVSSQIALTQAEHDLINARYDYQVAKAELETLVGREL